MSEAQIKLLYRRFKDGRESVESDRRSGIPSTSRTPENAESVRAAINETRRLTARIIRSGNSTDYCFTDFTRILARNVWRENLFRGSCHESRRNFVLQLHRTCLKPLKWPRFPQKSH